MRSECVGIINLDNKNDLTMNQLTNVRPIASLPIAGRYRVIDFSLSNMVNSGITNVGIFAKEKYRSLTDHLGSGKQADYLYLVLRIQRIEVNIHIEMEIFTIY